MSLFFQPLNRGKWIEIDKFISALECIQQMSFERASFFYQEKDGYFKKNVAIQKTICNLYVVFFKVIEYAYGKEITKEELNFVFNMALRNNNKKKSDYGILVKKTFERLAKSKGVYKKTINFQEFFRILNEIN